MAFHETATRLWKGLPREDRLLAAGAFFREPSPELYGSALQALVKARHMRPQAARSLDPDSQAAILATVLDPGESLAQGLLVSLHFAARRPLLSAFLDALALPHENGVLTEEAESVPVASNESTAGGRQGAVVVPAGAGEDIPEHPLAAGSGTLGGAPREPRLAGPRAVTLRRSRGGGEPRAARRPREERARASRRGTGPPASSQRGRHGR